MTDRSGYGDAEAQKIIERAARIDAERGARLNVPAIREIAAEAGISASAVDRAIEEHESAVPERLPWYRRHAVLITLVVIAAAFLLYALLRRNVVPL